MDHLKILLSPGSYFHSDHRIMEHNNSPIYLQAFQNNYLIAKYQLPIPRKLSLCIPKVIKESWGNLPDIAWRLGILGVDTKHHPYLLTDDDIELRNNMLPKFKYILQKYKEKYVTPNYIMAFGALQLVETIIFFDTTLKSRAERVFSQRVMNIMRTLQCARLPFNLIEMVCYHVKSKKNTLA
ncbi:hypothetical protein PL78_14510 [Yersinia entomophaga]|uniref:Uncharacterized protein n=1 Tax=Yersinia entomophaga TaxID=935293 RepID=A0ABN4Q031_YERET|nr:MULTISPECIES: hypothetical protein [Yersinia]ANI31032.1 hypothetical protein PL78_14510 [Yersinia entomophaga]OWF88676.1 hypothetical protein B4914_06930 [Yersinia entomophaga]